MTQRLTPFTIGLSLLLALHAPLAAQREAPQQYTLLIYEGISELGERTDPSHAAAYWARYAEFAAGLQRAGVLRGGTALATGSAVRAVGAVTPDQVHHGVEPSGYFEIEVSDAAEAERWARLAPGASRGLIEIRRHVVSPAMK